MKLNEVRWPTATFLVLSPIGAAIAIVWAAYYGGFQWQTMALMGFMIVATGLSITAGYHRLFSHVTYEANRVVRWIFTFFGAAALQKSVLEWSHDHRNHHRYVDSDRDPYSTIHGFFHAHMGWLFRKRGTGRRIPVDFNKVKDLSADPFIKFQHDYYGPFAIFSSFIFPGLIAMAWGDFWGGVLFAGLARVVLVHHATFCINSFCHYVGSQPYSVRHSARDSWITAFMTFGEGYHNYHHEFQGDYRNGIRPWQYDPTKWLIWTLSKFGLAWNLKQVPEERILKRKLEIKKRALVEKGANSEGLGVENPVFISAAEKVRANRLALKQAAEDEKKTWKGRLKEAEKELKQAYNSQKIAIHQALN